MPAPLHTAAQQGLSRIAAWTSATAILVTAALVSAGCGDGEVTSDFQTGQLTAPAIPVASLTPAQFQAAASKQGSSAMFDVVGSPKCTVNFYKYTFTTRGAANEATSSTAGVMTPSGDPACAGARPVVLYAHGTAFDKSYDMASPNNSEAALVAATYAAQGYIVVAPNYAGYGASTLAYHPYLLMEQQSNEMVHAWHAIKGQLPDAASSNGKLLITGYSQGGYVAMATQRALQLAGTPATAAAPLSGPYALGAFMDTIFAGHINAGATLFAPMLITSMQKAYGNIYATAADLYEAPYAKDIEGLLPNATNLSTLISQSKLPKEHLFAADSLPQPSPYGFGDYPLLKTDFRNAVLADIKDNPSAPKHPARIAAYKNDLLQQSWVPNRPMLLCGGKADPMVFYDVNTTNAKAYFEGTVAKALVTVLDVDSNPGDANDPFAKVKDGFAQAKAAMPAAQVQENYHSQLVAPFCQVAARSFFEKLP